MEDKSTNINSFTDFLLWQKCRDLRKAVSEFCSSLPKSEEYKLKDQVLRASRSATANIAEGYERFHFQENIQFCRQARGSLYELIDHFTCATDEGYIRESDLQKRKEEITRCIQLVNGYIGYLQKSKSDFFKEESMDYTSTNNE